MKAALLAGAAKVALQRSFAPGLFAESYRALREAGHAYDTRALANAFPRGFDIAVVEHIVEASNAEAERALLAKYDKAVIVDHIVRNDSAFAQGILSLPTEEAVMWTAMNAKMSVLQPYKAHWPRAVALEWRPMNIPYTMLNLGGFVDTTCYHMERVTALCTVLQPARQLLMSRRMQGYMNVQHSGDLASQPDSRNDTVAVLHAFLDGMPLASAPHHANGILNPSWFARRAKVSAVYCATMASLMGDDSPRAHETHQLSHILAKSLF